MRAGQQKRFHFVAAEIENVRAPVLMKSQARVFVLIQGCSVKARQGKRILRKMRGHPIENHTDARLMTSVDKKAKIIG